jgi:hypothetical protein
LTEQGKKLTDKPTNQATARRGRLASLVQSTGSFSRLENTSNLLQNYTAVQKVLKAKFDDGLSNANTSLFYMSKSPKTYINAYEPPYKTLLAKNVNYFFNVNTPVDTYKLLVNRSSLNRFTLNSYFYDLPFLLSRTSDASKFSWFDWFARWASMEIQASSIARFSILGIPYINKSFDFNVDKFEEVSDSELYLIRIARARRNYLSSW